MDNLHASVIRLKSKCICILCEWQDQDYIDPKGRTTIRPAFPVLAPPESLQGTPVPDSMFVRHSHFTAKEALEPHMIDFDPRLCE